MSASQRSTSFFRRSTKFLTADAGVAALEFSLGAPLLVALLIPMVDFGIGFYHQMQVQDAAQAGAQYALIHGWNSANSNAIQLAVTNATSLTSISPSPAPVESCGCPQGTSVAAVSCGGTCTNGQTA